MIKVSIVGPDEGEKLGGGPLRIRIIEDGSTTAHRLGLGEITIAPHTDGPPQHRHAQPDEGFYVISGTARFTIGPDSYDTGPGTFVMVPTGAPHTFANAGDEPVVLLNTFTPDLYVRLAPFAAAIVMVTPAFPAGLRRLAIALMALACTLMIVLGVTSRIIGLPGVEQGEWDAFIVISLLLEAAFLALTPTLLAPRRAHHVTRHTRSPTRRERRHE